MADKKLNIKIATKGAQKSKKALGGVNKQMKSLAMTAVKAGGAFFAVSGIIRGFSAVIKLAGEQEQAEKKLQVALGHTSKALLDQATALQKVTTFGDEAIIGVQASLAAFLDSEEAIKKATEATLDISVAMGMDLKAAGDLVAKTLGSSTNAMSRYGIQVEGAVGSTERLESLTGNVARLFGGQAKAQAETMAGSMEQAKNAIGDTGEAIGSLLAPAVTSIAQGFTGAAEAVSDYVEQLRLSKTSLEGIVDTETRIEIIQAKLSEARKQAIREETDLETHALRKFFNIETGLEKIARLENELAIAKRGNFFEFSKEGQAELDRLQEQIEMRQAMIPFETELLAKARAQLDVQQQQRDEIDFLIDNYPELAKQMGLISSLKETDVETGKKQIEITKEQAIQMGIQSDTALGALRSLVKAKFATMIAGMLEKEIGTKGFAGLATGAIGAALAMGLFEKLVPSFAQGGQFITDSPQMIMVGDNPGGRERVTVEPLSGPGFEGGITVNIMGGIVQDDYVRNELIPAINKAKALA